MNGNLKVNRCLADQAMDAIDHALGRPLDPMTETYRNYYAAPAAVTEKFTKTPHWQVGPLMPGGLVGCVVTYAGRKALTEHLRAIGDRHRAFAISFNGHTTTVIATSASKARHSYFLDIRDCFSELTFADFCRRRTIRRAGGPLSAQRSTR